MSFETLTAALRIPAGALVGQRLPNNLLAEQASPTAGDRHQIQDGIEEIVWVAALRAIDIGVSTCVSGRRCTIMI
jgi:hypothetical protein